MAWQGFLSESKSYMSYEHRSGLGKLRFWVYYPTAWFRFNRFMRSSQKI